MRAQTRTITMSDFDKRVPIYPIRTIAQLTGVPPRRIRAWERQNQLFSPARTAGGHRLFSEDDVERVRWIKTMVDRGMSLKGIERLIVIHQVGADSKWELTGISKEETIREEPDT